MGWTIDKFTEKFQEYVNNKYSGECTFMQARQSWIEFKTLNREHITFSVYQKLNKKKICQLVSTSGEEDDSDTGSSEEEIEDD